MAKPTIYDIKYLTQETSPYYFTRDTMKFFGQTLKDFKVMAMDDGRYRISAPTKCGNTTVRYFNPTNNELELD